MSSSSGWHAHGHRCAHLPARGRVSRTSLLLRRLGQARLRRTHGPASLPSSLPSSSASSAAARPRPSKCPPPLARPRRLFAHGLILAGHACLRRTRCEVVLAATLSPPLWLLSPFSLPPFPTWRLLAAACCLPCCRCPAPVMARRHVAPFSSQQSLQSARGCLSCCACFPVWRALVWAASLWGLLALVAGSSCSWHGVPSYDASTLQSLLSARRCLLCCAGSCFGAPLVWRLLPATAWHSAFLWLAAASRGAPPPLLRVVPSGARLLLVWRLLPATARPIAFWLLAAASPIAVLDTRRPTCDTQVFLKASCFHSVAPSAGSRPPLPGVGLLSTR